MNTYTPPCLRKTFIYLVTLSALAGFVPAKAEIVIPSIPLDDSQNSAPLIMLVAGKDHKQFYEAYNDTSDLDGDGTIDIRFNPRIVYYGLFDSKLCYKGNGVNNTGSLSSETFNTTNDHFYPSGPVTDMQLHKCGSGQWSGNFLNYITTSRMDALRKVLYGGTRSIDTATDTILRRAYIPKDGHAWGKEYTSVAVDGYHISDYTPHSLPSSGKRHFFGNYTWTTNLTSCATPSTCRNAAPTLALALNAESSYRIWDWAGAESDKLFIDTNVGVATSNSKKYVVQIKACSTVFTLPDGTRNYRGENCRPYTNSQGSTVFKPVGVLHKFGEDGSVLFGLLTGSYDTNVSGGVLRKPINSFAEEVNPQTGQFTSNATIVKTFDNIMVRGFKGDGNLNYKNYLGGSILIGNRLMNEGEFPDWGNPIGEMMYEALRYLGGEGQPTPAFSSKNTIDNAVGLSRATWDKPYNRVLWCSRPNLLVLSDINPSFDSDQLPGARFNSCTASTGDLNTSSACTKIVGSSFSGSFGKGETTFNVKKLLDSISEKEGIKGEYFIGQSGNDTNWAPTAKNVTSLADIRGLAPEDPGKEGSYTSAAVAYYGKTVGIPTSGAKKQTVDTWVVALTSPLPKIEVPTSKGTVTIVPFGKSIASKDYGLTADQGYFQPSNQIVKFYITNINPRDPNNGGRYSATFQISYEDVEQGGDHDMDFIVEYQVKETAGGKVEVKLTPAYFAAGITMNVGYIISGTTEDGPYLVVQNRSKDNNNKTNPAYYLNSPYGTTLPACSTGLFGKCTLGQSSVRTFTPSNSNAATLLKDPLWYAAKWGGFRDNPGSTQNWPNTPAKWDANGDGQPDNYFSVRNATQLEKALVSTINSIRDSGARSSGQISTSSDILSSSATLVFNTTFRASSNPPDWSGDLIARTLTRIDKDNPSGIGPVRWHAAEKLPAASSRRIFTRDNANLQDISSQGVEFKWDQLNPGQQTALGSDVLDYIRGSAEKETAQGGTFRSRSRAGNAASPLGDSPSNTPRYFKPTNTVYLGANDGMLHAFDAETGQELFAYIPSALIPKLPELARTDYGHNWYVDGEVAIGSIKEDESGTTHMLVGALGRGGKGLFGLNVTNPDSFSARKVAWELNGTPPGQCGANPDHDNLGLVLGKPFIGTFNDGGTYALVGNGYNSCSGKAALYIINIQTGQVVRQIETPATGNNGLSTPVALDVNGDGKIDLAWAGDLLGNLWRFDLRADSPKDWSIRFGSFTNQAMFTARNDKGESQPITAPPAVTLFNSDKGNVPFVFFGTGRYLAIADKPDQTIQSWYGLIDNNDGSTIARHQLTRRKLESFGSAVLPNGKKTATRTIQKQNDTNDMHHKRGWFIDFDVKADTGERVISVPFIIKTRRGTVVEIPSIIPSIDTCKPGERGYLNFVSAFSGAAVDFPFIDINGDGIVDDNDILPGSGGLPGSIDLQNGMPGNLTLVGDQNVIGGTGGGFSNLKKDLGGIAHRGRISWREIIQK